MDGQRGWRCRVVSLGNASGSTLPIQISDLQISNLRSSDLRTTDLKSRPEILDPVPDPRSQLPDPSSHIKHPQTFSGIENAFALYVIHGSLIGITSLLIGMARPIQISGLSIDRNC